MEAVRGRPPKAEDQRRQIRFQIRLSATELKVIERAAEGRVSSWARDILLEVAKRKE